jgi:hypothetical protein
LAPPSWLAEEITKPPLFQRRVSPSRYLDLNLAPQDHSVDKLGLVSIRHVQLYGDRRRHRERKNLSLIDCDP